MQGKTLMVATSHLESPSPPNQMFSEERVAQAKEALNFLKNSPNAIFCGDMNWDDVSDGQFPLFQGWVDAWIQLRPRERGWTYDTNSNPMLSANRPLQKRLDRFVCNLQDFKLSTIDMIGMEAIHGLSYYKEKRVRNKIQNLELPVLPSDHYGLLLELHSQ
uniref:Endonuclease/exonuclease/phosphatase domain-containing protein n=1 Tax=Davidia involucrata TaxID=16924 RepID=A0A5B7AXE7_DAVIN